MVLYTPCPSLDSVLLAVGTTLIKKLALCKTKLTVHLHTYDLI